MWRVKHGARRSYNTLLALCAYYIWTTRYVCKVKEGTWKQSSALVENVLLFNAVTHLKMFETKIILRLCRLGLNQAVISFLNCFSDSVCFLCSPSTSDQWFSNRCTPTDLSDEPTYHLGTVFQRNVFIKMDFLTLVWSNLKCSSSTCELQKPVIYQLP